MDRFAEERLQCPQCASFNDANAILCNQCGYRFVGRRVGKEWRWLLLPALLLLFVGGLLVLFLPPRERRADAPVKEPVSTPGREPGEGPSTIVRGPAPAPESGKTLPTPAPSQPVAPPAAEDLLRGIAGARVRVDCRDGEGKPISGGPGLLAKPGGAIVTRYLLIRGAYSGVVTSANRGSHPIEGVIAYSSRGDVALIRADMPEGLQGVSIYDGPSLELGDAVQVLVRGRLARGSVTDNLYSRGDGIPRYRVRLDQDVREGVTDGWVFRDGALFGLLAGGNGAESVVTPLGDLVAEIEAPVAWSLETLTRTRFEGTVEAFLAEAEKAYTQEDWERALNAFRGAVDRDSSLWSSLAERIATCFMELARRYGREGLPERYVATLREARRFFPGRSDFTVLLGRAFLQLGRHRDAIATLLQAIDEDPRLESELARTLEDAYLAYAGSLRSQGSEQAAGDVLLEARDALPDSAAVRLEAGRLWADHRHHRLAVQYFQEVLALDPGREAEVRPLIEASLRAASEPAQVVIRFQPETRTILTEVVVNGRFPRPFIVDTGADHTAISASTAAMLGIKVGAETPHVRVATAGGYVLAPVVQIDSLDLAGLVVQNVPVMIMPQPLADVDPGLLGMDFLKHFRLTIDNERGELRIEGR